MWAQIEANSNISLVSYFVVFYKQGFSPTDLRKAQQVGVYFVKGAPDFVNYKGQSLDATKQINAFAQAQSIGWSPLYCLLISS